MNCALTKHNWRVEFEANLELLQIRRNSGINPTHIALNKGAYMPQGHQQNAIPRQNRPT